MRVESHILAAHGEAVQGDGHSEPGTVLGEGDGGRARVQVQHGADHVACSKPLPVVRESAVGGKLAGASVAEGPRLLTYERMNDNLHCT